MVIRPFQSGDEDRLWSIFQAVVAGRDTYTFLPDTPRDEALAYFVGPGIRTWVAEADGGVVGMYKLIPNRSGLGSHVSNASFMVDPSAAGKGIGRALGEHCLYQARLQGYEAMQFNFVVSTNDRAVALWKQLGFEVVGRQPGAFRHGRFGLVDAYVMHRSLHDIVPVFGTPDVAADVRACAYAVLVKDEGALRRIAVVDAARGIMLPGGGLDPGESHRAAVVRETAEECALEVRIVGKLGRAVHFVTARRGPGAVEKRKRYYTCAVVAPIAAESEHPVYWLTPHAALDALRSDADRWAVRRWLRLNT